jgi:hypothetical protein
MCAVVSLRAVRQCSASLGPLLGRGGEGGGRGGGDLCILYASTKLTSLTIVYIYIYASV